MLLKVDHFVVTTPDPEACLAFYEKLGFRAQAGEGRYELYAGDFKINVHKKGSELLPHAGHVQTGSADFCLEISGSLDQCRRELEEKGLAVELGIVDRTGVRGPMRSLYLRDPDGSLVELCSYE